MQVSLLYDRDLIKSDALRLTWSNLKSKLPEVSRIILSLSHSRRNFVVKSRKLASVNTQPNFNLKSAIGNIRTTCEICSKLTTTKATEWLQWSRSGVFTVNFVNRCHTLFWCFQCLLWTCKSWLVTWVLYLIFDTI